MAMFFTTELLRTLSKPELWETSFIIKPIKALTQGFAERPIMAAPPAFAKASAWQAGFRRVNLDQTAGPDPTGVSTRTRKVRVRAREDAMMESTGFRVIAFALPGMTFIEAFS